VRAFLVVRSRFAEDTLAHAIGRGASQFVILGAGLDTFAYRNPYDENRLRVFEVGPSGDAKVEARTALGSADSSPGFGHMRTGRL
jgi:Leucine carboxyl methyltransferase